MNIWVSYAVIISIFRVKITFKCIIINGNKRLIGVVSILL